MKKTTKKKWIMQVIGRYIRVFKSSKAVHELPELLDMITSNEGLLKEITESSDIKLSNDLVGRLFDRDESDQIDPGKSKL